MPPRPHVFMAWCLIKHRDNFTVQFCQSSFSLSLSDVLIVKAWRESPYIQGYAVCFSRSSTTYEVAPVFN
jgi:hypothetical protein